MNATYLSQRYHSLIGITLLSGCGLLGYYVSIFRAQARIKLEQKRQSISTVQQGEPSGWRNKERTSDALVLEKMIDDAKNKSFREKIEAGYDAAVRTHNIGFPSSTSASKDVKDNSDS